MKNADIFIFNQEIQNDVLVDYFSIGVHPWESDQNMQGLEKIEFLARDNKCLAIGEVGLDKLKGPMIALQEKVFLSQILLAEKLQLPIIIHCVKAWNEIRVIKRRLAPKQIWVYHGFTKVAILKEVLKEGLMISVGGAIMHNQALQKALLTIPNDKFLLETDDSAIGIHEIYKKVSALKNISLPALEKQIEENFKCVFTKWKTGLNVQNS